MSQASCVWAGRRLLCATFLLAAAATSYAGDTALFQRQDYVVGNKPTVISAADFNLDGKADLTLINRAYIRVLYGEGEGVFSKPKTFGAGRWPSNLVVADFNADTRPDAAVLNFGALRIALARDDGRLRRKAGYLIKYPFLGLAMGDFNNDSIPDIAVGRIKLWGGFWGIDHAAYYICIFTGVGDGTFIRGEPFVVGKYPSAIVQGDFNKDGNADLAVSTSDNEGGVSVLYGAGDATFPDKVDYPARVPDAMITADFDVNGRLDIAIVNSLADEVAVLYGGDGGFAAPVAYPVVDARACITCGDFNADAILDIAVGRGFEEGYVTILYGQAGGGFGQATDYGVGSYPAGITAADLNGDFLADIAVSNKDSRTISVLLNLGTAP